MSSTELPWTFLGRRIRPYALAVSLASAVLASALLWRGNDAGLILDQRSVVAVIVGTVAAVSTFMFWGGWWARSDALMRHGLLFSAGVFAARFTFLALNESPWLVTAQLSACWAVASAGAFLLESTGDRNE